MSTAILDDHEEMCVRRGIACLRCWRRSRRMQEDIPPDGRRSKLFLDSPKRASSGIYRGLVNSIRKRTGGKRLREISSASTERGATTGEVHAPPKAHSPALDSAHSASVVSPLCAKDCPSDLEDEPDNQGDLTTVDELDRTVISPGALSSHNSPAAPPRIANNAHDPSNVSTPALVAIAVVECSNAVAIVKSSIPAGEAHSDASPPAYSSPCVTASTPGVMSGPNKPYFVGLTRYVPLSSEC